METPTDTVFKKEIDKSSAGEIELEVMKAMGEVNVEIQPKITFDVEIIEGKFKATSENASVDDSYEVGGSVSFGAVEVEGSVNLSHLVKGSAKLVEAAVGFMQGLSREYFDKAGQYLQAIF